MTEPQRKWAGWLAIVLLAGVAFGALEALRVLLANTPVTSAQAFWLLFWAVGTVAGPAVAAGVLALLLGALRGKRDAVLRFPPALLGFAAGFFALASTVFRGNGWRGLGLPLLAAAGATGLLFLAWRGMFGARTRGGTARGGVIPWLVLALLTCGLMLGVGAWRRPGAGGPPAGVQPQGRADNVLLITIDTLRADHLGTYGHAAAQTPTIDSLAAEGVLFEQAYAPSPITCPSHTSILTGLDPLQHGAVQNKPTRHASVQFVSDMLRAEGYDSAAFISAVSLSEDVCRLTDHFDDFSGDLGPRSWLPQIATRLSGIRRFEKLALRRGNDFERVQRPANETVDRAIAWLERSHDRPFFVWVHLFDPHLPFSPPPGYVERLDPGYSGHANGKWHTLSTRRREEIAQDAESLRHMILRYDAEIAFTDEQVKRLLDALQHLGLDDKTLVVLTADHGESHGEHQHFFERDLYFSCLHVPLIVRPPAGEVAPRRVTQQVGLIDVTPTILDYLGLHSDVPFSGRSLMPLLHDGEDWEERPIFSVFNGRHEIAGAFFSVRSGGYKLIENGTWWYSAGIREHNGPELYDVRVDPRETQNIVEQAPEVRAPLSEGIEQWKQSPPPEDAELSEEARKVLESLGYAQ